MRVAETRLAEAARHVAELSSRQIEIVGSTGWNFDMDFDFHDKPVLGITIGAASEKEPVEGVSIIGVSPGGAAADAGLRSGDVITAVNKDSLSADSGVEANQKLVDFLEGVEQGDVLDVTYLRAGKTSTVEISPRRMTARVFQFRGPGSGLHAPMPSVAPTAPGVRFEEFIFISGGGWGDLEMVPLTKDLGRYFGVQEGLLVVRAPTDEKFKLRDGDVIEDIDGRKPESVSHAIRILGSYQGGEELEIKIMRDKRRQTLKIEMPDNRRSRMGEFMVPHVESSTTFAPTAVKPATAPRPVPAEEST
jgi:S1-C subfamily serine protease